MVDLLSKLTEEIKAYNDPVYFCEHILHLKPYKMQAKMLREFYMTDPPDKYTHLILTCGMRSGKTQLGAMATTYELFRLIMKGNPQEYYQLPPGQPIYILHVANSRDQAKDTIYAQTAGLLEHAEWFWDHGLIERHNEFVFPKYHLFLRAEHSNSASLAGRTAKAVVLDETARFKDNQGKFSGDMVYYTVSRAVKTFGREGKVFSVSSPIFVDDFQMKLMRQGKKIADFLTYQLPTWEMNPRFTYESLKAERLLNPETFWRDYGARPSKAVEAYYKNEELVDAAFDSKLPELIEDDILTSNAKHIPEQFYYLAGDPAVKNDAFGIALVHGSPTNIITDFVHRFEQKDGKEIDAEMVKQFIISVAKRYPLRCFIVDTWQFPETLQAIEREGVLVKQHTVKKAEHDCLKECIYTGKIKIPVHEKLNEEIKGLELIRGIKVDHPRHGTKDMVDALANAVWELVEEQGEKPEVWIPERQRGSPQYITRLPSIEPIDEVEFHEYEI